MGCWFVGDGGQILSLLFSYAKSNDVRHAELQEQTEDFSDIKQNIKTVYIRTFLTHKPQINRISAEETS